MTRNRWNFMSDVGSLLNQTWKKEEKNGDRNYY